MESDALARAQPGTSAFFPHPFVYFPGQGFGNYSVEPNVETPTKVFQPPASTFSTVRFPHP